MIFRIDLESLLIFILFLKRKNKIRKKKPLSVTLEGKQVCEKLSLGSRVKLPIGKIRWKTITPLKPYNEVSINQGEANMAIDQLIIEYQ